jgi:hypothetical protein
MEYVMSTMATRMPIRLTRRGRVLVTSVLAVLAAMVVVLVFALPGMAADPPSGPQPATVVRSGDTLWSIAARHAPRRDRFTTVDDIRRLNHLDGYVIRVGQRLVLPRVS